MCICNMHSFKVENCTSCTFSFQEHFLIAKAGQGYTSCEMWQDRVAGEGFRVKEINHSTPMSSNLSFVCCYDPEQK